MAVVSNNISNVNTPGYTREVANLEETPPVNVGNLQYGTGVAIGSIQSVRDNVLQLRLTQETENQGQLNTLSNGLNQIQTLFNEPAGSGLQSSAQPVLRQLSATLIRSYKFRPAPECDQRRAKPRRRL